MAADIHALEIEFAKNPTLDACLPLCQAYLSQKRFMEAMVVCKKGIKSAPNDPRGPLLLARVYFDQGKLPKAEQELAGTLQRFPGYPPGFELMGQILLQQGRQQEAVPLLQQAAAADGSLTAARSLLAQLGVAAPAAAPAQRPPAQAPMQRPAMQAPPQGAPPRAAPPMQAPGMPPQMPAGMPPLGMPAPKLEHVSDFFAQETLGFASDGSHIETAGPGRLTILGFVPKAGGSVKTTIFVALTLLAAASAVVFWQYDSAQRTRRIDKLFKEVRNAIEEDKFARYDDALRTGEEILKIDANHNRTLSAMAYVEAVLASDHRVAGAAERAQGYLRRALAASNADNEFRVAAQALLAHQARKYEQGIGYVKAIQAKGGSDPLIELEGFRLMHTSKPDDKETQTQLARLIQSVVSQARILNVLGWYYYEQSNWAKADQYFDQALQNSKDHPQALLGQAMVDLGRGIGLQERQKEVGQRIKKVFSLPKDELSQPVLALAHFARAVLLTWQGNSSEADVDFKEAFRLDPDNATFHYRRGQALYESRDYKHAIESLSKAVGIDGGNVRFYKALALAQTKAGDFERAKSSLDKAAQLAPSDYTIKLSDAERLVAEKKFEAAVTRYKSVTAKDDGNTAYALAQVGISSALRISGKKDKAVKHMEAFMKEAPGLANDTQAQLWCELGQAYESMRNRDLAMQMYTTAIEQYPYDANCHYYLCRALGRGAEGKQECKTYLALAPNGEFAEDAKRRSK